ncbi:MAG: orc1/cdc6 family replication initiation protein, partial [Candidatus Woesearchaeota archaeon]|nr:orc1/cdc6 family replication initiation protein [Candidatus Woesearchaeota archaeon]
CLKKEKPSNIFIYGKTGTGKTLVTKHIANHVQQVAESRSLPVKIIYTNCKLRQVADTEYRLLVQLLRELGKTVPPTGLPTAEVYNSFYQALDENPLQVLLILDEIDELVGKVGNDVLYNLTRCSSLLKKTQVTIIGICNNIMFTEILDPRVRSSLSEEELIFPPYNATQLQSILKSRSKDAFQTNSLETGVIEKCAAYAAREHGDARRALDLLRVAGELAERSASSKVLITHLDEAESKLERDHILDAILTQPKQYHAVLYAICHLLQSKRNSVFTGEVYAKYQGVCDWVKLRPLTQRRVSDVLGELDMLGIINAPVISKGRYGRTRQIQLGLAPDVLAKVSAVLEESLALGSQHAQS